MRIYLRPLPESVSGAALHSAAYRLLREALARDFGLPEADIRKTDSGAPYLSSGNMPHISVAHTRGLVCCAVGERPVGVDCEPAGRFDARPFKETVLRRICKEAEAQRVLESPDPQRAFLQHWVLKESISKAEGKGFTGGFQKYEIDFENNVPRCGGYALKVCRWGGWHIAAAEKTQTVEKP